MMDITKKLVRGKKITIEGGECRWIHFKYERLPNFCYKCGLLSHAIRDCPDSVGLNVQFDENQFQYGAWLRGKPSRKGGYALSKSVAQASPNGNVVSGGETRQAVITAQVPEVQTEIGRAYVEKLTE